MWALYFFMAVLVAGVTFKLVHPLVRGGKREKAAAVIMIAMMPVLSIAAYLFLGRPDVPAHFAVYRDLAELDMRHAALLAEKPYSVLLNENPEDIGALVSLANINLRLGKPEEAAQFFARAVEVARKTDDTLLRVYAVAQGEAMVAARGGIVDAETRAVFEYVRTLYPQSPIARYYLALAKAQGGDRQTAISEWSALLTEGAPNAHWKKRIRNALAAARAEERKFD